MRVLRGKNETATLACALLVDGKRVLFLRFNRGKEEWFGVPFVLLKIGENPVEAIAKVLHTAGIDAHVGGVVRQGMYNSGSRKNRRMVPALGFSAHAKRVSPSVPNKWMDWEEARRAKLTKESLWLA